MLKKALLVNAILATIIFYIMLCPKTALALEFDIWIGGSHNFPGLQYLAEQGVDFEGGLFYTSNAIRETVGFISVFDQDWEPLDHIADWNEHIGDITVFMGRLLAPLCSSPDNCLIREYFLSNDGLFTGVTEDHPISDLGFKLAGLDYYDYSIYGIEHSESGTANIVKFDLNFNYITKYEISSLYANGIEINSYNVIGDYVFVTRGDYSEFAYIDIYSLSALSESELNEPISSHEIPTNYPYVPGHAEGLTISGDQIWLAQGFLVYMGTISITHTITASSDSNGSIDPEGDIFVERGDSKTFHAIPNTGYEVDRWYVDGQDVGGYTSSLLIENIQADRTVYVTFRPSPIQPPPDSENVTLPANKDTYVKEANPTLNFGYQTEFRVTTDVFDNYGLIEFNLDDIPYGSVIDDVKLQLYCYFYAGSQIYIAESDSSWSETSVDWNTKPAQGYEFGFFYNVTGEGYLQITDSEPLKNLVQGWINGTESNYGLYIYGGENGDNLTFYSSEYSNSSYRPQLIVTYIPPEKPDLIVADFDPTPRPINGTYYVGDSVSWEATIKNNSGGPAGPSEVGYYIGNSPTDLSTPLSSDPTDGIDLLDVGESQSESSTYVFTTSDMGQRYLICKADNDDEIDEIYENNNNWVYGPFTVAPSMVATPTISPNGGTFMGSTQVILSCSTSDAIIHYTTDGFPPTTSSTQYTGAFAINSSCTLKARGFKSDYTESEITTAYFIITPEEIPELSVTPASQTVNSSAGTGTFDVSNTGTGTMAWTSSVISGDSWLSLTSGASGTDSGTITFEFVANNSGSTRTGTIRVTAAGATGSPKDVTVIQPSSDSNDQCNYAYITNTNSNSVSVINISTNIVVDTINVGSVPYGVAVNPLGTRVYITNQDDDTVSVIDTSTNTVIDTITVGDAPIGVAVNPSGTLLYVVNAGSYTVSVIDTSTNIIIDTISEGFIQPIDILINPSGTIAYVSNHTGHSVSVIDTSTNTVVNSISVVGNPIGIAINPSGTRLYVAAEGNYLSVIDTTTNAVVESIDLGLWSGGVAVHPFGTMIYVAIHDENDTTYGSISVIDTSTNIVIDSIDVGNVPLGLSVNPSGTHVYVANYFSNTVSVIDTSTNTVVDTITVGDRPAAFGNFISTEECMESVPNVIGLSQANAESTITSADLIVGTITSAHSDTVPAGNVISQNPVSGSFVVIGSAVDIIISLGQLQAPEFVDELAVDFGGNGLWHYDGSTWNQLNGQNPEGMEEWDGGLAADFSSSGLWNYDGSSWNLLTTLNPQGMRTWTNGLAVDFSSTGLWNYNGSSWDLLTTNDPQDMESWTNGLAVDFGTFGLWNYDGSSWNLLTTSNAQDMTAWTSGLVVDFGTFGLWNYNGSSWDLLTTSDAQSMEAWSGQIAVDFDTFGLWNYNGSSWNLLTTSNAEFMAAWTNGLAVDFGGTGLWSYDGSSWDLLTTSNAQDLEGWATSLAVDLGASGLWNYDGSSWTNLTGLDSEDMIDVDLF